MTGEHIRHHDHDEHEHGTGIRGVIVGIFRPHSHDTSGSSCRWGVITQYIRLGSVHELDASCMDKQKPAFLIMD